MRKDRAFAIISNLSLWNQPSTVFTVTRQNVCYTNFEIKNSFEINVKTKAIKRSTDITRIRRTFSEIWENPCLRCENKRCQFSKKKSKLSIFACENGGSLLTHAYPLYFKYTVLINPQFSQAKVLYFCIKSNIN